MGEVRCKQDLIQFSGQPDKNGCLWHLLEIRLLKLRKGYKVFSVTQLINDRALGFAPKFFWLQRWGCPPHKFMLPHKRCYFLKECVCVYRGGENLIQGVGWQDRSWGGMSTEQQYWVPLFPISSPSHLVASLLRHSHTNVRNGESFLQLGSPSKPTGWRHRALKKGEGLLSHPSIQTVAWSQVPADRGASVLIAQPSLRRRIQTDWEGWGRWRQMSKGPALSLPASWRQVSLAWLQLMFPCSAVSFT